MTTSSIDVTLNQTETNLPLLQVGLVDLSKKNAHCISNRRPKVKISG